MDAAGRDHYATTSNLAPQLSTVQGSKVAAVAAKSGESRALTRLPSLCIATMAIAIRATEGGEDRPLSGGLSVGRPRALDSTEVAG
jgi:hypothetical protein